MIGTQRRSRRRVSNYSQVAEFAADYLNVEVPGLRTDEIEREVQSF